MRFLNDRQTQPLHSWSLSQRRSAFSDCPGRLSSLSYTLSKRNCVISNVLLLFGLAILLALLTACGGAKTPAPAVRDILIDGSSTVYPITEAMAEEFGKIQPNVRVTVGVSGTGGGFKKFCVGETDISDASRPIKPSEAELCRKNGIEYIELPVAYDGLAVICF